MINKRQILQTVVEMPEFIKQAEVCMDSRSKKSFIDYIAAHPLAGDIIQGTGGARKIRWANQVHQGKRSGARIIYYYYDQTVPIFLFTAYAKNQKDNLTAAEKKAISKVINMIVETYEGKS